jgi:hypothetical protein
MSEDPPPPPTESEAPPEPEKPDESPEPANPPPPPTDTSVPPPEAVPLSPAPPPLSASPSGSHDGADRAANAEEVVPFKEAEPLNGIFAHLTRKHNGNLHTKGIVIVSASSTLANQPWQVIEADWKSHWVSDDLSDSWIRFDFKTGRMLVTHYTLKTYNYVAGGNHLRSWVLLGSTNENDWLELDRRQSTSDLNDRYRVKTFQCKNPGCYRFIKLVQTGKSHCDSDMLALTGIEFFGTLRND